MTIFQLKKRISRDLSRCIGAAKSRARSYRGRLVFLRAPSIQNIVGLQPPATLRLLGSAIPFGLFAPSEVSFPDSFGCGGKSWCSLLGAAFAFWLRWKDDVAEVAWGCGYGGPQISEDWFRWPFLSFIAVSFHWVIHAFLSAKPKISCSLDHSLFTQGRQLLS